MVTAFPFRRILRPAVAAGIATAALTAALGLPTGGPWSLQPAQAGVVPAPATGAAGATWSGQIVIQNNGTEASNAAINFYSTAGVLMKIYSLPAP
ncbi:MAG: hypothetical protein NTZ05_06760, partial [Chloroflexi bacterium]|nr:hypothetical protein [Chloroflexota bacterium]